MTVLAYIVGSFAGLTILFVAVVLVACLVWAVVGSVRDWWQRNRDRRISTFFKFARGGEVAPRGKSDMYAEDLGRGYTVDGSHDRDDDLEPGLRVCEVDMLERWWALPNRGVKS